MRLKGSNKQKEISKFAQMLLGADEISLLTNLTENDGRLPQRELEDLCGFSKSKTSRHLSLLEEKGLIIRQKFGRSNRVYLTEDAKTHLASLINNDENKNNETG